jgi:hypothetical protein
MLDNQYPHAHAHSVGRRAFFSDRAAASSQTSAICRKILRSRSDRAVLAQPRHSSANSRYSSADDMLRPLHRALPIWFQAAVCGDDGSLPKGQIAAGSLGRRKLLSTDFGRRARSGMMAAPTRHAHDRIHRPSSGSAAITALAAHHLILLVLSLTS